jgi:hypothetical protein
MDRRRAERFEIISAVLASLTIVAPEISTTYAVELLEIGSNGALVAARESLEAGQEGWFSASLSAIPFSARVELVRVEPATLADGRGRYVMALSFRGMAARDLTALKRFLGV